MTQTPQRPAVGQNGISSQYPGWTWDASNQQWVPQPQQQQPMPQPDGVAYQQQWADYQQQLARYQQQQAQYAQYQQAVAASNRPPTLPGPSLGMHLKRAIDWNVSEVVVSPREKAALEAAGVSEPRMQGLMSWRRSSLLVVLPVLLLSVVLSVVEAATTDTDGFTPYGKFWVWLPTIGLALIPLGALRVISSWTELRRSSRVLIGCWVGSIALPLFAAIMPLEAIIDIGSIRGQATTVEELAQIDAVILTARLTAAVSYALTLLPVIITVPNGVIKGAGRVKTLFPAAVLPGWFLVTVAPFYSMFMVVVFVLIEQIVGNMVLMLGIALLALSPWMFVIKRRTYARSMSIEEAHTELARAGRAGAMITLAGFAIVVIYALTAKVQGLDVIGSHSDTSVFTYVQVSRTMAEVLARNVVTAVVFCLIFLSMVYAEWRASQQVSPEVLAEHDREMNALRRYEEKQPVAR